MSALASPPGLTLRNLSVLGYANGFTHWHYKSGGDWREGLRAEFWREAHDLIAPGDIAFVCGSDGAAQIYFDRERRPRAMSWA